MGNITGNSEDQQHSQLKLKYLRMIEKSQHKFATNVVKQNNESSRFNYTCSIIGDSELFEEMDWKVIFEEYLEEKKDAYFWTADLLE